MRARNLISKKKPNSLLMIQDLHLYQEVEEQYMTAGIYDSGTRKSKRVPRLRRAKQHVVSKSMADQVLVLILK
jgi:hypothetical protein